MIKVWLHIILFLIPVIGFSQIDDLKELEIELNEISLEIVNNESDQAKELANQNFKEKLLEALNKEESFDYNFKNIQAISILKSNDHIKIYNWTLPYKDQTYKYFAFVQIKTKKGVKIVELTDKSESLLRVENKPLTNKTWYGALYYKIIHHKKLGKSTYTLLGWDGDNNLTNKKIIEVMTVSASGTIRFNAALLKVGKKSQRRVIFTYSETAVMSLKYHEQLKKIIFDYLVPPNSNLNGVFEYYGPALNRFDGFFIERNKWVYEEDVEIQLGRNLKDDIWKDPKER